MNPHYAKLFQIVGWNIAVLARRKELGEPISMAAVHLNTALFCDIQRINFRTPTFWQSVRIMWRLQKLEVLARPEELYLRPPLITGL